MLRQLLSLSSYACKVKVMITFLRVVCKGQLSDWEVLGSQPLSLGRWKYVIWNVDCDIEWLIRKPVLDMYRHFDVRKLWVPLKGIRRKLWRTFFLFFGQVFLKFNFCLFIYFCAGSLLLCGLSSSCEEWGLLSSWDVWASHRTGLSCYGGQALRHMVFSRCGSQALEHWLNSRGTQA